MTAASITVRIAASALPRRMRDRYREQWLSDLRDAEEAGIRPSEIVIGSLAFAATLARPMMSTSRVPHEVTVERRSRLASALALSAAVLAMSQFAGVDGHVGLTGNGAYDFIVLFLGTALLYLYLAFAVLVAVVLVTVTRDTAASIRVAVILLVVACLAGFAYPLAYSSLRVNADANMYLVPGLTFAATILLSLVAGGLLVRHFRPADGASRQTRRPLVAAATTIASIGAVALGLANVLALRSDLHRADLAFVERILTQDPGQSDWIGAMLAHGDESTTAAIATWAISAALLAVLAGVSAYFWPRQAVLRTLALLCLLLTTHAGILTFVWIYSFGGPGVHLTVSEEVLLLVGRVGLVGIILFAVGGLRFAVARHHDVEGAPA